MNIKWYKNPGYLGSILGIFIIIFLAILSVSKYSVGIITDDSVVRVFSVETFYRIMFNPLWTIVLWAFSYGKQINSERHYDILQNIQGALDSCPEKNIRVSKIYEMIYKHDDVEHRMEKRFKEEDTINNGSNNPNPVI